MYTKNEQDALDAVQECAMHAMISMDKLRDPVVTVDEMNDTGAGLYQVVKTKFEITVEKKCSEERMQSGVILVVLDVDGNIQSIWNILTNIIL